MIIIFVMLSFIANMYKEEEKGAAIENPIVETPTTDSLEEEPITEEPAEEDPVDGEPVTEEPIEEEPNSDEPVEEEPVVQGPTEKFEIVEKIPTLTLDPHESMAKENLDAKLAFPLNSPYYGEDFRFQVISYTDDYVEIEFGNTSDNPITLTDDNFYFLLVDGVGQDISNSKLVGSPITIKPDTIESIKITKNPRAVHLRFTYGDLDRKFDFPLKQEIEDTKPLERYLMNNLMTRSSYKIYGNGKIKYQVKNALLTNNKNVQGINLGDNGKIILVKVQLANTSDEVMNVSKLKAVFSDFTNDLPPEEMEIPLSVLGMIEENALPTEIQPQTIVEGYLPGVIKDINIVNNLEVVTNLGSLYIANLDNYTLWQPYIVE